MFEEVLCGGVFGAHEGAEGAVVGRLRCLIDIVARTGAIILALV